MKPPGFALLMTLWLLVPVSILLLLLTGVARSDSQVAANQRDAAIAIAAADGGIETAIMALLTGSTPPSRVTIGDGSVQLSVVPLSGLVNPNLAGPDLLQALLVRVGIQPARAAALAAAIVEWRTPGARGRDGQEKAVQYRAAGLDYGPPGAPFETVGELRGVIGMPQAAVAALRPVLSVFTDRPPEPALAPPLVRDALASLGVSARRGTAAGTVFRITAAASLGSRPALMRSAVIRLGGGGRPWTVLAWGSSDLAGQ